MSEVYNFNRKGQNDRRNIKKARVIQATPVPDSGVNQMLHAVYADPTIGDEYQGSKTLVIKESILAPKLVTD